MRVRGEQCPCRCSVNCQVRAPHTVASLGTHMGQEGRRRQGQTQPAPPALNLGCGHSSRTGPCWGWMVPPGPKVQAECRQWLLQLLASVLASTERCGHPTQQIAHSRCRQLVDVRVFPAPNPQTTCFCTKDRCRCPQITVRKRWPP